VMVNSFGPTDGTIIALANDSLGWQLKTTQNTGVWTFDVAVSDGSSHIERYSNTVPGLNTWYHVAGVYNAATQSLDIYVNGVLDDAGLNGTVPRAQVLPAGVNATIGQRGAGNPSFFNGTIDEVRVYDTAVTESQIQTDMNQP